MLQNWKKYLAEVVGTAVLTLVACGVAVAAGQYATTGVAGWWVGTSLAFGLVIVAMAYSIGNVSGCHINPAVSFAFFLRKQLSLKDFCFYVLAQIVGAFIGTGLLALCLRGSAQWGLGQNAIQSLLYNHEGLEPTLDAWSYISAFLVEVLLTFVFVIAILGVTDKRFHEGKHAGIVIGLVLALVHLFGLGFTGTSVNPARSLAPAVAMAIAGDTTSLSQIWIWILAPLAGAALAAFCYGLLTKKKAEAKKPEEKTAREELSAEDYAE